MQEPPLVSVIIPAYNERNMVAGALKSAKRQTYDRVETIVVANACSDDTAKVAREFADRVIEIHQQGISNAKNLGAEVAQGSVYTFLDADSEMKNDLLEKVYCSFLSGHNGGKAAIRSLDDDGPKAKTFCRFAEFVGRLTSSIPYIDSGLGAFTFASRDLFDRIKATYGQGFRTDRQVLEDVDFLTNVKRHGNYDFITDSCVYTSMRRFAEEGYLKCQTEDFIAFLNPDGKTRKRWNRIV